MICKNCGRELKEDSTFCDKCGTKLEEEKKPPSISEQKNDQREYNYKMISLLISFILAFFVILIATSWINNSTKKATVDDIVIDYELIPTDISEASVIATFQSNEKIKKLKVKVFLLDGNEKILKTQILELGTLTPGNEYREYISLSGLSLKQIYKIESLKIEIIEGHISK